MTEPDREPTEGPFPSVPAGRKPERAKEPDDEEVGDLAATIGGKIPDEPNPALDEDDHDLQATIGAGKVGKPPKPTAGEDLNSTIISVKIQQIPGLKLVKELGRGAAGVVYHGKQEFLDREVAVKMLLEQRKNKDYSARFKREAKLLAGLQHPHIVACYQADVTPDGVCFLVMEFVDGPNLREYLVEHGPLEVIDALRVCRDVASALDYAYKKTIIHRDVKSENVLLAQEPNAPLDSKFRYRAKLSDLGLARPQSNDPSKTSLHLTVEATVMGTPLNMSPEQFDDPQGVDHRSDIYSLGCVLYDLLVAKPAFTERTLSSLVIAKNNAVRGRDPRIDSPGLDAGASDLVMRMLAAKREDRPQTYAELIESCERLIERLGGGRAPPAPRSRAGVFAAVAVIGVLGGVGIWWALKGDEVRPRQPLPTEFALSIDPPIAPREGEEVTLRAVVTGAEDSAPELTWEQISGPKVSLKKDGNNATFIAPRDQAEYDLEFFVRGTSAGEAKESPRVKVHVAAKDDAPIITIKGEANVAENGRVTLTANVVDPDEHGKFEYTWTPTSTGPAVRLEPDKEHVSFTAPEAAVKYDVELALALKAGEGSWQAAPFTVHVAAVNNPPTVKLFAPKSAEALDVVSLEAQVKDVDSPNDLKYEWKVESPAALEVKFDDPTSLKTMFTAPENPGGDYTLTLALLTKDGDQQPTKQIVALPVSSNPALNSLDAGKNLSWMGEVAGEGISGWARSQPGPDLNESPDKDGFVIKSIGSEGWITRESRRGAFVLDLELEPQITKTAYCGVRIVADAQRAVSVCFIPKAGEECGLVSFATTKVDGGWSMPGMEKMNSLDTWSSYETLELEFTWDGSKLKARWRDPASNDWSTHVSLDLPSRPRSVELFARQGMMLVKDVTIKGL